MRNLSCGAAWNRFSTFGVEFFRGFKINVLIAVFAMFGVMGTSAAANNWLVNLDNKGFDPSPAGRVVTLSLRVSTTTESNPATTVEIDIPENALLLGFDPNGNLACGDIPEGGLAGATSVTCTVPALADEAKFAATNLYVKFLQNGSYGVTATLPSDDDAGDNVKVTDTTIQLGSDLTVSLTGPDAATVASGSRISFVATATNLGPDPTSAGTLSFTIPDGLTNVAAPAGCSRSDNILECDLPAGFAMGQEQSFSFTGQISDVPKAIVTPVVQVATFEPLDGVEENNLASTDVTVSEGTDVALTKTRSPAKSEIIQYSPVTFTLNATYTGEKPGPVTVTDTVPDLYTIQSISAAGWDCDQDGQTVTCSQTPAGETGANVSLGSIVISTIAENLGTDINSATLTVAEVPADQVAENNIADDGGASVVEPYIDLAASITGPKTSLMTVGQPYEYTLGTSNIGNVPYYGTATIDFTVPADMTLQNLAPAGWSCSPAAPITGLATLTCTQDFTETAPLGVNASTDRISFDMVATTAADFQPEMLVTAGPNPNIAEKDENLPNNSLTYPVGGQIGGVSADLTVSKSAQVATLESGDIETFDIEVINAGPDPADNVIVTDILKSLINSAKGETGAGYIGTTVSVPASMSASDITCSDAASGDAGRFLQCEITQLPVCSAGNCPVFTVQVRPGGNAGTRTNIAEAYSYVTADPNLANNAGSASYTLQTKTDVTVRKNATLATAIAGQPVGFVIQAIVPDTGKSDASGVIITDTLPLGVEFISATPSSGSCGQKPAAKAIVDSTNQELICNLGTIKNGKKEKVVVVVRPTNAQVDDTLTNTVAIALANDDGTRETDYTNNTAEASVYVSGPELDLQINIAEDADPLARTMQVNYTVTARNNGNSVANNVVFKHEMPLDGIVFASLDSDDATCTVTDNADSTLAPYGKVITCTADRLEKGETAAVTITATGTKKGAYDNIVSVSSDETEAPYNGDTISANNNVKETTTVRTKVDLVVSKDDVPEDQYYRRTFDYVVRVTNTTTEPLKQEADEVVLTDVLPDGLLVDGTVTASLSGLGGYAGATGDTILNDDQTKVCAVTDNISVSCDLKTLPYGETVTITIPTKSVNCCQNATSKTYVNSATVETSSMEYDKKNNTDTGSVKIVSSVVTVQGFYDFNDNGLWDGDDRHISKQKFRLSGTAFDGTSIVKNMAGLGRNGTNSFVGVPAGVYSIEQIDDNPSYTLTGKTSVPNISETDPTPNGEISANRLLVSQITVGDGETLVSYRFPKVPLARIGISKYILDGPTVNENDGSFDTRFRLDIDNFSIEPLIDVKITDNLAGALPTSFGKYTTATSGMNPGEYTILDTRGTCGDAQPNKGFTGERGDNPEDDTNTVFQSGFRMNAGGSCYVVFEMRVQPTVPLPQPQSSGQIYYNQAVVEAKGEYSGQTSVGNAYLTDLSDNAANPDSSPGGNGLAHDPGEDDPTPVTPSCQPAISLTKSIDFSSLENAPIQVGDELTYVFEVENTGNIGLSNVTVTDPILTVSGTIDTLAVGAIDKTTITGTYIVTEADLLANEFTNTATVTGTYAIGTDGTPLTVTDEDTVTETIADIVVVKTADTSGLSTPNQAGDEIVYNFAVTNTGNVPLVNVTLDDPLADPEISAVIPNLAAGATDDTTFSFTYTVTQSDIEAGFVDNQATVSGAFADINGVVQSVTDASGPTTDTDEIIRVPLAQVPAIELIKHLDRYEDVNANDLTDAGDKLYYTFDVINAGNLKLVDVVVTDPAAVVSEDTTITPFILDIGDTNSDRFTAVYTLTQADIDAGYFENSASVSAKAVAQDGVTPMTDAGGQQLTTQDVSDTGTQANGVAVAQAVGGSQDIETPDGSGETDGDATNDPTVYYLSQTPKIRLLKSLSDIQDTNGNGIEDAGDTAVYAFSVINTGNVNLTNIVLKDALANIVADPDAMPYNLAVGQTNSTWFTGTYQVTQADIDRGVIENTATVLADVVDLNGNPIIDDNGNQLSVWDVSDANTDASGQAIANSGSVETGGADGATNGNKDDDPTIYRFANRATVSLIKSIASINDLDGDGFIEVDDTVTYAFAVTNTGSVALANVSITDPLVTMSGGPIDLAIGQTDSTTFKATYVITQDDLNAGGIDNTATVSGTAVSAAGDPLMDGSNPLMATDVSDSGTQPYSPEIITEATDTAPAVYSAPVTIQDPETVETTDFVGVTDDDSTNDPTVIRFPSRPRLRLIKSFDRIEDVNETGRDDAGDRIFYTFRVENIGNVPLNDITIADDRATAVVGGPLSLDPFTSDAKAFVAYYDVTQADLDRGEFVNTATVSGAAPDGTIVSDVSDTGTSPNGALIERPELENTDDTDADAGNDPTVVPLRVDPSVTLIKTAEPDFSEPSQIGDWIDYQFTITNTGNRTLYNVTVTDTLPGVVMVGNPIAELAPGATDSTSISARYQLTLDDFKTAQVVNSATVTGTYDTANGLTVSDVSGTTATNDEKTVVIVGEPDIDLEIGIAEIIDTNGNANPDAGDVIQYTFTVINTGTLGLFDVNIDLASLSLPLDGLSCQPVTLVPDERVTLTCTGAGYTITAQDMDNGTVTLRGKDQGTALTQEVVEAEDSIATTIGQGGISITKTTSASIVYPGDLVPYTITVSSKPDSLPVTVDVVDLMPQGFYYQRGTARVNGTQSDATVDGRKATFDAVQIDPGATVAITLSMLVGADVQPGDYTNTAYPISSLSGTRLAPDATADVRVAVDAAMMCSSIIGRVFDDKDQNGVMDEGIDVGLPAVKLVTPRGLTIKTDEHGRYSVPCAALPDAQGGNFVLKLDERSLPTGYRLTTENPRAVRVTPGMLTKLNFGATLSRLVRIDLNASVFQERDGQIYVAQALQDGIKAMVDQLHDRPAFVRITYQMGDEPKSEARRNVDIVQRLLRDAWHEDGKYQLNVETNIVLSSQQRTQK